MKTIRRLCVAVAAVAFLGTPDIVAAHGGHAGAPEGLLGALHLAPNGVTVLAGVAVGLLVVGCAEAARRRPRG